MPAPLTEPRVDLGLVALGGAVGSLARLGMGELLASSWATLAANLTGCLLIGLLAAAPWGSRPRLRLLLGVGVLGGYTTFSTHLLAAHALVDEPLAAAAYVGGTLLGGLLAAVAGLRIGRTLGSRR